MALIYVWASGLAQPVLVSRTLSKFLLKAIRYGAIANHCWTPESPEADASSLKPMCLVKYHGTRTRECYNTYSRGRRHPVDFWSMIRTCKFASLLRLRCVWCWVDIVRGFSRVRFVVVHYRWKHCQCIWLQKRLRELVTRGMLSYVWPIKAF